MSKHQVDPDPQVGEYNFTNPEGHPTVDIQFFSDKREIIDAPKTTGPQPPLEERPIVLHYSNEHPYALAKVTIFGQELNPADYIIEAEKGLITLKYHWIKVRVEVDNETA